MQQIPLTFRGFTSCGPVQIAAAQNSTISPQKNAAALARGRQEAKENSGRKPPLLWPQSIEQEGVKFVYFPAGRLGSFSSGSVTRFPVQADW